MDTISSSARRITFSLFIAQSLASAGMIAIGTLNTIVGAELSGNPGWAGVPAAVYLVAGALAAFLWGYLMDVIGWRGGLTAALILGVLGGALAFLAVERGSWIMLLSAMVLIGTAFSAMTLSRFAAAEVHPPSSRGKAISNVVLGGTVGAVFGPLLVGPAGRWALAVGADELSGAYVAGAVLFFIAAGAIFLRLRPDPKKIGRQISERYPESASDGGAARSISEIMRQPAVGLAVLAMALGQMVMVLLMVITSLHMRHNQHSLGNISLVISAHTFGMFAFSVISGRLADRFGRGPVIAIGAGTLMLACLLAPLSLQVLPLVVTLFLMGLGWNFCFIGGSALLADQLSPLERTRTQGFNDLLVGAISALGSFGSGLVYAGLNFGVVAYIGVAVALLLLCITTLWLRSQNRLALGKAV
jgi:MFS family permease